MANDKNNIKYMIQKPLLAQIFNPLLDLAFLVIAIAFTNIIMPQSISNTNLVISEAIFAVVIIGALLFSKMYSLRGIKFDSAITKMVVAVILGAAVTISVGFLFNVELPKKFYIGYLMIDSLGVLIVSQILSRLILRLYSLAKQPEKIIIFGAGKTAEQLIGTIPRHYHIVGLLDNVRQGEIGGYKILDKLKHLDELLRTNQASIVIQTGYFEQTNNLLQLTKKYHAQLYIVPQLLGVLDEHLVDWQLGSMNIFQVRPTPLVGWGAIQKRTFDTAVSVLLILITLPLWLVILLLTWLGDVRTPVFTSELRINGHNGRRIKLIHFRTLRKDAREPMPSEQNYKQFALDIKRHINHPQATRIGLVLRKTGLAYLPELINVFKGELSLVGPRPPYLAEVRAYTNYEHMRFVVRPGMVSLAQMMRQDYGFEEIMMLDRQYIKSWSLGGDVKILFGVAWRYLRGAR